MHGWQDSGSQYGRQEEVQMPEKKTLERARRDKRQGKSPSTQAGEFVREEIHHVREGKHGARSPEQAIAIGLSKARRAGVKVGAPKRASAATRRRVAGEERRARSHEGAAASSKRSRAGTRRLKREGHSAASHSALARHSRRAAAKRGAADRSRAAKKAARTRAARASHHAHA